MRQVLIKLKQVRYVCNPQKYYLLMCIIILMFIVISAYVQISSVNLMFVGPCSIVITEE